MFWQTLKAGESLDQSVTKWQCHIGLSLYVFFYKIQICPEKAPPKLHAPRLSQITRITICDYLK